MAESPSNSDASSQELNAAQNKQTWRYVNLLFFMQAVGAASPPIIISLGGLIGLQLAENKALATLPVSLYNIGLALCMLPVAFLVGRIGRQRTYMLGTVLSALGGGIAALGIYQSSFLIFCIGTAFAGCYGACVQSYRFAVTDYVPKIKQPQAISRVMLGGLLAAIIGPQLVILGQDLFQVPLTGSFLSQSVLAVIAFLIISQMGRVTAGLPSQDDISGAAQKISKETALPPRTLWEIVCTFRFISTAFAGLASYGVMTFMMTATPMAIQQAGYTLTHATLGVQWHILAMYAPSLFTGKLMAKFGKSQVAMAGLLIIAAAILVYMSGSHLFNFWGGFILLGLGWNFGFIGATAMVTDCYRPNERRKVQALNDTLVFGTTATASLLSGQMLYHFGWQSLNMMAFLPIGLALLFLSLRLFNTTKTEDG